MAGVCLVHSPGWTETCWTFWECGDGMGLLGSRVVTWGGWCTSCLSIARLRSIGTVWVGGDLENSSGLEVAQAVAPASLGKVEMVWSDRHGSGELSRLCQCTRSMARGRHGSPAFSLLFSSEPQSMEWYCPRLEWVFPLHLI